jgi:catechol 2,3-dioxygenase-like lactoylglutathione lyase family enzyme
MIHHYAITPKDFKASHEFYTEAMGFPLVAAVKRQAIGGESVGWTKHVFYDCGDGSLLAIWDLHLNDLKDDDWKSGISTGLGLPWWINHIAFSVDSLDELEEKKERLLKHGCTVSLVEHEFITSIYTKDPDGTMVEFTTYTRDLTPEDAAEAEQILADDSPSTIPTYTGTLYFPDGRVVVA